MSRSFCTGCGCPLGSGGGFCEDCGAAVAPTTQPSPQALLGLGHFFASQAYLSLITLLVFSGLLIALAPVGLGYLRMQVQAKDVVGQASTRSLGSGVGDAPVRCSPIEVYFSDKASVTQVAALLESLDAVIALGPTENGSFEISVASEKAPAVTTALNKASDIVLKASTRQRCLAR